MSNTIETRIDSDRIRDFDVYRPEGFQDNYHDAWKRLQDDGWPAVFWTPRNGGHWVVTSGPLIAESYADHEHFSNHVMLVPKLSAEGERCPRHIVPSYVDPPEHGPYRKLLNQGFSPRRILAMRSDIEQLADQLIDSFIIEGQCDFRRDYAQKLPVQVFMQLVDLPMADAPMLSEWVDHVVDIDSSLSEEEAKALMQEVHGNIHDYMEPFIEARIGGSGTDMLSTIVNGEINGRPLTRDEMRDMCTQVMFGGLDTVVNFLGLVMLHLARAPELRIDLIDGSHANRARTIDEFLRRYPVVTVGREIKRSIVMDGIELQPGEMVMLPTALAGLDSQFNPDPQSFDPARKSLQHVTFGNGPHRCPGAGLARLEIEITINRWLARIPDFGVARDQEIRFRGGVVGGVDSLPLEWRTA